MSRVSHRQVEQAFESFAKACGKRITNSSTRAVGAWYLDGNNLGYTIYEVTGPHGAIKAPVSGNSARLSAREMFEAMHFAMSAIKACRRRRSSRSSRGSRR
jgi:hypothetical protein